MRTQTMLLIPLKHEGNDGFRNADIFLVNHRFCVQEKRLLGCLHISQQNLIGHQGFVQLDDFTCGGTQPSRMD
jgi:hypothetical protein